MGGKSSSQKKKEQQQLTMQAEKYYQNSSTGDAMSSDTSPKSQVQLHVAIKNAEPGAEYSVRVSMAIGEIQNNNNSRFIGSTSTVQADENRLINFDMAFILDYFFEKQQHLAFTVTKNNYPINVQSTLGSVMGSRGQTLIKTILDITGEQLAISATTLKNNNMNISLGVTLRLNVNMKVFYMIKKPIMNVNNPQQTQWISVYKSEVKNDINGVFQYNKFKIPSGILCNAGEFNSPVVLEFHDYNNQRLIGFHQSTVDKLAGSDRNFTITNTSNQMMTVDVVCEFIKEYTFLDYLRGGTQLALSIGVDFTGSNGHPLDKGSLHYIGHGVNYYEKAIKSCGEIVAYYDYDQIFPVYGYGALLPGSKIVSHCFPLSLSDNPNIQSIDSVIATYRDTVTKITFSGPTLFAPLITQVVNNIKNENNKGIYQILLILTDGMINDMDDTIDILVEASYLPLSVIIVGIGRSDFGNMNILDADDAPLVDRRGRKSMRDLVQFVPFYMYENDGVKLAEQVLEEVPRQLVEYYKSINLPPGDPVVI